MIIAILRVIISKLTLNLSAFFFLLLIVMTKGFSVFILFIAFLKLDQCFNTKMKSGNYHFHQLASDNIDFAALFAVKFGF